MGSRAYGIEDSDYDYVLIGNVEVSTFGHQCLSMAKMSPYFKYVKFIDGRIPTVNFITWNGTEINLIYQKKGIVYRVCTNILIVCCGLQ